MRMHRPLFAGTLFVALASASLGAHDFWLALDPWVPGGAVASVTAGIGEHFPTRTTFRTRDNWLAEWRLIGAQGEVPAPPAFRTDGLVLKNDVSLPGTGAYLGVAVVTPATIEMKGPEFTDYLREEGLDQIIEARRAAGESDKATTERYGRYAKVAIRTGAGPGAHFTKPLGLKAELVPATDPTTLRAGQTLTVQLLTDGRPARNTTVMAASDGGVVRATTDAGGRATFTIGKPGAWLIKTIHMVRVPAPGPVEWESFWTTLTFHVGA